MLSKKRKKNLKLLIQMIFFLLKKNCLHKYMKVNRSQIEAENRPIWFKTKLKFRYRSDNTITHFIYMTNIVQFDQTNRSFCIKQTNKHLLQRLK